LFLVPGNKIVQRLPLTAIDPYSAHRTHTQHCVVRDSLELVAYALPSASAHHQHDDDRADALGAGLSRMPSRTV